MHFTSVSCVQCYLSDDVTKGTTNGPNCKEQPAIAGNVLRYSFESVLTTIPFPAPPCFKRDSFASVSLWQSRNLKLRETSSLPFLAFINPKLINFPGYPWDKNWKVYLQEQKERSRGTPHQPGSNWRYWVLGKTGTCRVSAWKDSEPHVWSQNSEPPYYITMIATKRDMRDPSFPLNFKQKCLQILKKSGEKSQCI